MEDMLQHLEIKIKKLIHHHDSLNQAHQQLQQLQAHMTNDKSALLEKQKKAIQQIESLISKLREAAHE